jgi:hypothetical protein
LPKKVNIQQYYHLRQEDVQAILEHWTRRRAAGKVPFRFRETVKGSQQNERTSEINSEANMGPGEANEDLPNDDSSQAREDGEPQGDGRTADAADAPAQHQSGEGVAPGSPHAGAPDTHSQQDPLIHDGSPAGQSGGVPDENGGGSGSAALEPSSNGEVSNLFDRSIEL